VSIIELKDIKKIYGKDESSTVALEKINLLVEPGEFISVIGPSGSGKSTLLNIIGCMDTPTAGEYFLNGINLKNYSNFKLSLIRNHTISFVFQHFALLKDYTIYENIELPLLYRGFSEKKKKNLISYYMTRLGIESLARKKPTQVSGGQQQRAAIARALVSDAEIILADEPTGALDQKTGTELLGLLKEINKEGKTIIIVTHDPNVANITHRKISISDGIIIKDISMCDNSAEPINKAL
jgi:putative ABC transport system ATP-binding protein